MTTRIKEKTFSEFCYNSGDSEALEEALYIHGPDAADLQFWGLSEEEWREEVKEAIRQITEDKMRGI